MSFFSISINPYVDPIPMGLRIAPATMFLGTITI